MTETDWVILLIALVAVAIIVWLMFGRKRGEDRDLPPADHSEMRRVDHVVAHPVPEPASAVVPHPPERVIAPEPALAPKPAPAPAPTAPAATPDDGKPDNLLALKGVGPKIAAILNAEGVTRYGQIAAWTDADIAAIDAKLGNFAGRARRDNWVDQARYLAAGDTAGYEAKYGKL